MKNKIQNQKGNKIFTKTLGHRKPTDKSCKNCKNENVHGAWEPCASCNSDTSNMRRHFQPKVK